MPSVRYVRRQRKSGMRCGELAEGVLRQIGGSSPPYHGGLDVADAPMRNAEFGLVWRNLRTRRAAEGFPRASLDVSS
jgi:hypothetical protein